MLHQLRTIALLQMHERFARTCASLVHCTCCRNEGVTRLRQNSGVVAASHRAQHLAAQLCACFHLDSTCMCAHSFFVLLFAPGQLGLPPDQGSSSCSRCSSGSSSSSGPPGIVAAVSKLPVLEGRVVVSAAASLFNTALLTADGELYMLGKSVAS
jgi:hypothetical protein